MQSLIGKKLEGNNIDGIELNARLPKDNGVQGQEKSDIVIVPDVGSNSVLEKYIITANKVPKCTAMSVNKP